MMSTSIPKGYKLTEVGVIPAEWEVNSVAEMIKRGIIDKPLDGNHGNIHPKGNDFVAFGIPFVMASDIQNGLIDLNNCSFIRKEQADRLQKGFAKTDDVLLTHKATIGHVAIVGQLSTEYIMLTPQVTYYRVSDRTQLSNFYLRHYFDSHQFQKTIALRSGGGTRSYIGISAQQQLPVILPPLAEQKAIAQLLSDTDALIASLDKLIAKKKAIKQGTMQELLTGRRRIGKECKTQSEKCKVGADGIPEGYKQTEVGVIPEEWDVKALSQLFKFSGGYTASREQMSQKGFCYLHYGDIHLSTKTYINVAKEYQDIPKLDVKLSQVSGVSLLEDGDIVFVDASEDDDGASRHVVVINDERIPYISGLHTIVAKGITDELYKLYRRFCFQTEAIKKQFKFYAVGTKVSGISKSNIAKIFLPIPPLAEQKAIAQVLSDMDSEIAELEQRREKSKALKQGLMQVLLTGKVRLG